LLTASLDGTLRVWEISSARCLNYIQFARPLLAVAIGRNGDLYLSEQGCRHVRVCFDASLTQTVHLWREPTTPTPMFPITETSSSSADSTTNTSTSPGEDWSEEVRAIQERNSLVLQSNSAISMSDVPKLMWATLFRRHSSNGTSGSSNDLLRMPVVRESVPFFLQAAGDISGKIVFNQNKGSDGAIGSNISASGDKNALVPILPSSGSRLLGKNKKARAATIFAHRYAI
jgi:hypothetical protein